MTNRHANLAASNKADKIQNAIIEALQFAKAHNYSDCDTAIAVKAEIKMAGFNIVHKRQ